MASSCPVCDLAMIEMYDLRRGIKGIGCAIHGVPETKAALDPTTLKHLDAAATAYESGDLPGCLSALADARESMGPLTTEQDDAIISALSDMMAPLDQKGDVTGHIFHGNQYSSGVDSAAEISQHSRSALRALTKAMDEKNAKRRLALEHEVLKHLTEIHSKTQTPLEPIKDRVRNLTGKLLAGVGLVATVGTLAQQANDPNIHMMAAHVMHAFGVG